MSIVDKMLAGALGYAIASSKDSKVVGDIIDNNIQTKSLEEIIQNYARKHLDIYGGNNDFAHRLHKIAEHYEEYNYDQVYGDGF